MEKIIIGKDGKEIIVDEITVIDDFLDELSDLLKKYNLVLKNKEISVKDADDDGFNFVDYTVEC